MRTALLCLIVLCGILYHQCTTRALVQKCNKEILNDWPRSFKFSVKFLFTDCCTGLPVRWAAPL